MKNRKNRRDRCKCGRFFYWDTSENYVKCPHCGIKYVVDCDSVLVYWLVERIELLNPYKTDAR